MVAKAITLKERQNFPTHVCRHFDRFIQYRLPVPVDPMKDIYRRAFSDRAWVSLRYLLQERPDTLSTSKGFDLYLHAGKNAHMTFPFNGRELPPVRINLWSLPSDVKEPLTVWANSLTIFRRLRRELYIRLMGLMGNAGQWGRGGTLDPAFNTPGQVYAVWPELQPFFLNEWKDSIRGKKARSRVPEFVGWKVRNELGEERWATPAEFNCTAPNVPGEVKRNFKEITEILQLVALATDIPDVEGYPTFHNF